MCSSVKMTIAAKTTNMFGGSSSASSLPISTGVVEFVRAAPVKSGVFGDAS